MLADIKDSSTWQSCLESQSVASLFLRSTRREAFPSLQVDYRNPNLYPSIVGVFTATAVEPPSKD